MRKRIKENQSPWLNEDGTKKSDREISKLGKHWNQETWTRFLDDDVGIIHENDYGRLVFYKDMNKVLDTKEEDEAAMTDKFRFIDLCFLFSVALDELAPRERAMLKKIFWECKSLKETAKEMKINCNYMRSLKQRTLAKLGQRLRSQEFAWKLKNLSGRLAA